MVFVRRPKTRRVRRQNLINQDNLAINASPFEFGVGQDDSSGFSVIAGFCKNVHALLTNIFRLVFADDVHTLLEADVFVVCSPLGFCGRGEYQFRQFLALPQARRQLLPANRTALAVFFPARAGQISPHHTLDGKDLAFLDQHAPPGELIEVLAERLREAPHIVADEVMFNLVTEKIEPEA